MRWFEKYIPETDEAEDKCEIYALESEGDVLVKYEPQNDVGGWREIEPEEVASAIADCITSGTDVEQEIELKKFCTDRKGYVKQWCENVRIFAVDTQYATSETFFCQVSAYCGQC